MNVDILIKNASELLTCKLDNPSKPKVGRELANLGIIKCGVIGVKDGRIAFVSSDNDFKNENVNASIIIDAKDKVVMPGFVDSHTHAIFGGSREDEFLKKLQGISYLDILKQGGGILSTVEKTRKTSKEDLFLTSQKRFWKMLEYGTTTVEVKSGYGLTFEDEKKILEVADMIHEKVSVDIIKTYLGAHTVPKGVSKEEYVKTVILSLEKIIKHAEYCDVFCEKGVFTLEDTRKILTRAKELGFKLKLHSEQCSALNSAELASELSAVSADHLEHVSYSGMKALAESGTVAVLLPGVAFYLMEGKYAPARELIENGVPIAIASDFNPGSCPSFNMQFMITLSCLKMRLLPAEAINAATINAAFAIDRANIVGSLEVGKKADIIVLDIDSYNKLPYYFGINLVDKVIKNGRIVFNNQSKSSS